MTTRGKLTEAQKCWRCRGDGYYFRVPNGCNPFLMGALSAAQASRRVDCFECGGTGHVTPAGRAALNEVRK